VAQMQQEVSGGLLYRRYLRALEQYGDPEQEQPSPGHVIRHCHRCGQRAMFRLDPEGMWYECLHCKHYD
jgi:hypothetical protein